MWSCLTTNKPIIIPCSVNDFVNILLLSTVNEYADVFPCGLVSLLADVCNTCVMFIGNLLPPKYSGLCCLASGDDTPKYERIISVYLVPFLASLSSTLCIAKASLNVFTVAAVACVKSAYRLRGASVVLPPDIVTGKQIGRAHV